VRDGRPAGYANGHPQPVAAMTPDGLVDVPAAGLTPRIRQHIRAHVSGLELRLSEVCASGVRATTNRPLVSLSSR